MRKVMLFILVIVLLPISGCNSFYNSYIALLERTIDFKLPHDGVITRKNFKSNGKVSASPESIVYEIVFTNTDEAKKFETTEIKSDKWASVSRVSTLGMLPNYHNTIKDVYDDFMLYNATSHKYNEMPATNGTYHYIYLAYRRDTATMSVIEYDESIWY